MGKDLREAINRTFMQRKTELPTSIPVGLSKEFSGDPQKQTQWKAFLRKNRLDQSVEFPDIVTRIANFLVPVLTDGSISKMEWTSGRRWTLPK
jgi:hypothetical protein